MSFQRMLTGLAVATLLTSPSFATTYHQVIDQTVAAGVPLHVDLDGDSTAELIFLDAGGTLSDEWPTMIVAGSSSAGYFDIEYTGGTQLAPNGVTNLFVVHPIAVGTVIDASTAGFVSINPDGGFAQHLMPPSFSAAQGSLVFGVRFTHTPGGTQHYGWVRLGIVEDLQPEDEGDGFRSVHIFEVASSTDPIQAGLLTTGGGGSGPDVPEPGTVSLAVAAGAALARRRARR